MKRGVVRISMASLNLHKHLDLVSGVIDRMANNSFIVRGWSITITIGVLAFSLDKKLPILALALCIPLFAFWMIDAYYLWKERAFRELFDMIRLKSDEEIDYDMRPSSIGPKANLLQTVFAPVLVCLYGSLIALASTIYWVLGK
jgi:hypothetical protein